MAKGELTPLGCNWTAKPGKVKGAWQPRCHHQTIWSKPLWSLTSTLSTKSSHATKRFSLPGPPEALLMSWTSVHWAIRLTAVSQQKRKPNVHWHVTGTGAVAQPFEDHTCHYFPFRTVETMDYPCPKRTRLNQGLSGTLVIDNAWQGWALLDLFLAFLSKWKCFLFFSLLLFFPLQISHSSSKCARSISSCTNYQFLHELPGTETCS